MAAASSDGRVVATKSWLKHQVLVNTVSYRDARTGKEQWRTTVKDAVGALGIWRNVVLVVGLKLRALDARTGREVDHFRLNVLHDDDHRARLHGALPLGEKHGLSVSPRECSVGKGVCEQGRPVDRIAIPGASGEVRRADVGPMRDDVRTTILRIQRRFKRICTNFPVFAKSQPSVTPVSQLKNTPPLTPDTC